MRVRGVLGKTGPKAPDHHHHHQKTVVMRIDLALARMTHTPSKMMKITIDVDETSSLSIGTYHRQKTVVMRMNLALARMSHYQAQ